MQFIIAAMHAKVGEDCEIAADADIGHRYAEGCTAAIIGDRATIRSGARIYADVTVGNDLITGHDILIREHTTIGDSVVVGTNVVIEGQSNLGNHIKLETGAFVPTHTDIGDHVFVGPHAVLTNDRYPQRRRDEYEPTGPTLEDNVTVGANATVLPDVTVGEGAMIGAGSVVTEDVPEWSLATGVPASIEPLPDNLNEPNQSK